jgi:hypothetical protein
MAGALVSLVNVVTWLAIVLTLPVEFELVLKHFLLHGLGMTIKSTTAAASCQLG